MRKGNILPIAIMAFAIVAFLLMIDLSIGHKKAKAPSLNTNAAVNLNTVVNENIAVANSNVTSNTNTVVAGTNTVTNKNTNTVVDPTADWLTYTNKEKSFSFKYPTTWTVSTDMLVYGGKYFELRIKDEAADAQLTMFIFPMLNDETDPSRTFTAVTGFLPNSAYTTKTPITIGGVFGTLYKGIVSFPAQNTALIDHNLQTFEIDQGNDTSSWRTIISTFAFTDKNVDLEKTNPITKVTEVSQVVGTDMQAVSVLGNAVLLGGGKKLELYNGTSVSDLSSNIASTDPAINAKPLITGPIVNNGHYWLISTTRVGEQGHLYSFDGKQWADLTSDLQAAMPRTIFGGMQMAWNGTYWLIAANPGFIGKYDGHTFTDLTSQVQGFNDPKTVTSIAWNGEYFLITKLGPGNHGQVMRYDGTTFSVPSGLDGTNYITSVAWNGKYWLFSGFNNQHLLKYDGTTFTDLGAPQHQQSKATWLKSLWIVGPWFFDGKTLDTTTPFNVGYRVNDISLGTDYGIMLGENGAVYKFEY